MNAAACGVRHSIRPLLHGSAAALLIFAGAAPNALAQAAFTFGPTTLTYSENFDSMGATGTSLVTGWVSNDTNGILAGNGSANSGSVYNVGTTAATDRAIGSLGSGSLAPGIFGTSVLNGTGTFIGSFSLAGFMEQWRTGDNIALETSAFEFSLNATSLSTGTWTALSTFDLVEVAANNTTTPGVALDGNLAANRTAISASATVAWPNGTSLWFRWTDPNNAGADGLYAIDDFSMTVVTTTPPKDLIYNPPGTLWDLAPANQNWLDGVAASAFTAGDNANFTQAGITAGGATVTVDAAGISAGNINVSNTSGTYTLAGGPLTGTGVLTKTGAGTLELATTYSNSILVNGGIVKTMASDRIGDTASVAVGEGATFDVNGNLETIGALTMTGGTVTTGPGLLTLGGPVTTAASASPAVISGFVDVGGAARTYSVADGTAVVDLQIDAALSGGGRITLSGPGTVALNGDNVGITTGFTVPTGANIEISLATSLGAGTLFFNGGKVTATADLTGLDAVTTAASLGGNVTLSGSPLQWAGAWSIFGTGAQTRTVTVENDLTFSGGISGADDTLNLAGTGSVVLDGTNALAVLNVANLDVLVNGTLTGNVFVNSGSLGGTGTVGNVTLRPGGILAPGEAGVGTLTGTGFTWDGGGIIVAELAAGNVSDTFDIGTGVLTKGAAGAYAFDFGGTGEAGNTYTLLRFGSLDPLAQFVVGDFSYSNLTPGLAGSFVLSSADLTFVTVPEPGALVSLAFGGIVLLGRRARRR